MFEFAFDGELRRHWGMHRPVGYFKLPLLFLALLLANVSGVSAEADQPALTEIVQLTDTNGLPKWLTAREARLPHYRGLEQRPVWLAFASESWPPGLVPIYTVERRGITELHRRPPRGQENFVEPLFFALPATGETNAAAIAGRWQVRADNTDGHRHQLIWELALEGDQIAGRFDQNSEYRFAFINGGTWRSNRLELLVQNVNEHFTLVGELTGTNLTGSWRRTDDSQSGTWTAEPLGNPAGPVNSPVELVDLFGWQMSGNPAPRYGVEPPDKSGRWQPSAQPLGRVWRRRPNAGPGDAAD